MRRVTLHIPDKKYPLFIKMAKSLDFVKKIEEVEPDTTKKQVLNNLKTGIEEVRL